MSANAEVNGLGGGSILWWRLFACLVTVGFAVAGAFWISLASNYSGWTGLFTAALVVIACALLFFVSQSLRSPSSWLATCALAAAALGTGLGRDHELVNEPGGTITSQPKVTMALLLLSAVLLIAAATWLIITKRRTYTHLLVLHLASVFSILIGFGLVSFLTRNVIVGGWVTGRPVRRHGRVISTGTEHVTATTADLWRLAAKEELAASRSFALLAADLLLVGAPADLVLGAVSAEQDEQRHAMICLGIAENQSPAFLTVPMAPQTNLKLGQPTLQIGSWQYKKMLLRLAVESLVDGAFGEGFAAARLASSRGNAKNDNAITSIAVDERQHADLGARIALWCYEQSPAEVGRVFETLHFRIPESLIWPRHLASFTCQELRSAGFVDRETATTLWEKERSRVLNWVEQLLSRSHLAA